MQQGSSHLWLHLLHPHAKASEQMTELLLAVPSTWGCEFHAQYEMISPRQKPAR